MLANAMKDIENTYLKDFKMSLAPNTTQKFSLILKKDITYVLYLYSSNKEDNLVAQIGSKLPDESTVIEKELSFSSKGRITFTPNRTGAYHLMMENLSSKNATALMLLTLKEINNSVENDVSTLPEDEIFTVVEQMPSFGKGNPEEFRTWVTSNMQYPKEAAEKGIQGKVYVQFIVTKDGSLKSPKVIKSVNPLLDAEALRVVSLSPKWNPGMQRGAAVNVQYAFPITFTLK